MTITYPAYMEGRHPLVELPEGLGLIDTGSPWTFSEGSEILVGNRAYQAQEFPFRLRNALREHVHPELRCLIGMNVLESLDITFEMDRRAITFSEEAAPSRMSCVAPVESCFGVPVISGAGIVGAPQYPVIWDTGAQISYALPGTPLGEEFLGTVQDFYPLGPGGDIPVWEARTYSTPFRVGGVDLNVATAAMPEFLALLGHHLLGAEILQGRRVVLSMRDGVFAFDGSPQGTQGNDAGR